MNILFLCTGNACRSQMAQGWAHHLAGDWLEAQYKYNLSVSALSIHMRRCEKELHSKIDRKDVSK